MKILKINLAVLVVALFFFACNETDVHPDRSIDNELNALSTVPDPLCPIIGDDWDGVKILVGDRRTFSIQNLAGASFSWTRGNSNIRIVGSSSSSQVTIEGVSQGSSTLTVQRSKDGGASCSNQGTVQVVDCLNPPCDPPLCTNPSIVYINQITEECVGDFVVYEASVPPGSCAGSFSWSSSGDGLLVTNPTDARVTAETYGSNFIGPISATTHF